MHRPVPDEVAVERVGERAWARRGPGRALRAVRFQDLTDDEALAEIVQAPARPSGVDRLLSRAGRARRRRGDDRAALTFEWWRDDVGAGLDRGGHHRATRRERLARHGRLDGVGDGDDDA